MRISAGSPDQVTSCQGGADVAGGAGSSTRSLKRLLLVPGHQGRSEQPGAPAVLARVGDEGSAPTCRSCPVQGERYGCFACRGGGNR